MFRIPHWILLVGVFRLWIRLKHLLEFPGPVISSLDTQTEQKLNLHYDIILFYIRMERMLLDDLIIWPFASFAKFTCSVHPSPKIFSRRNYIVGKAIQKLLQLSQSRTGCKEWMFIWCLYLKKGKTFASGWVYRLVNQWFQS